MRVFLVFCKGLQCGAIWSDGFLKIVIKLSYKRANTNVHVSFLRYFGGLFRHGAGREYVEDREMKFNYFKVTAMIVFSLLTFGAVVALIAGGATHNQDLINVGTGMMAAVGMGAFMMAFATDQGLIE